MKFETCIRIAVTALALAGPASHAQDYPTRPVKVVVP